MAISQKNACISCTGVVKYSALNGRNEFALRSRFPPRLRREPENMVK